MQIGPIRLPLWERWNKKRLLNKLKEIGTVNFNRGFRQIPFDDENKWFPHFSQCVHYGIKWQDIVKDDWRRYTGVDISSKTRPGTVIFTIAVSPEFIKTPVDIRVLNNPVKLADVLIDVYEKHKPDIIMVENNAVQDVILDMLKLSTSRRLPLKPFTTGKQKFNPEIGLPSLDVEFENGQWFIAIESKPEPTMSSQNPWVRFLREFENAPYYESTDIIMAAWFAREAAKKGSVKPVCKGKDF